MVDSVTFTQQEIDLINNTILPHNDSVLSLMISTKSCSLSNYKMFLNLFRQQQMTPMESRVNQIINNKFFDTNSYDAIRIFNNYDNNINEINLIYNNSNVVLSRINYDKFINRTNVDLSKNETSSAQQLIGKNINTMSFCYIKEYNSYSVNVNNLIEIDGQQIGLFKTKFNNKSCDFSNAKDGIPHEFNVNFIYDVFIHDVENNTMYRGDFLTNKSMFSFPTLSDTLNNDKVVLYVGFYKGDEEIHYCNDFPIINNYMVINTEDTRNTITANDNNYLQFSNIINNTIEEIVFSTDEIKPLYIDVGEFIKYNDMYYVCKQFINTSVSEDDFNSILNDYFTIHLSYDKIDIDYELTRHGVINNSHPLLSSMYYIMIDKPKMNTVSLDDTLAIVTMGKPQSQTFQSL